MRGHIKLFTLQMNPQSEGRLQPSRAAESGHLGTCKGNPSFMGPQVSQALTGLMTSR